jgi:hypothetical protein
MRKLYSFLMLFFVVCLISFSPVVGAQDGQGDEDCDPVTAIGSATITGPNTGIGQTDWIIDGKAYFGDITLTFTPPTPQPNGTLTLNASHTFTFFKKLTGGGRASTSSGSITTSDSAVFTPTSNPSIYTLLVNSNIISGTGNFSETTGQLVFNGQIFIGPDGIPTGSASSITGSFCEDENENEQ